MSALYTLGGEAFEHDPEDLTPEERERVAAEAVFYLPDGTMLAGAALDRMRARFAGAYDQVPPRQPLGRRASSERLWLFPGLWPWATKPMLGGNQKAGKTTLAVDMVAALLHPERAFLGRFEMENIPEDEWYRGVLLINAETPAEDLEAELLAALDGSDGLGLGLLMVEHLEQLGGPQLFDLTDPAMFDLWANRLVECFECNGEDDRTPFVVIVDGLTAILGGRTERYGEWYAAFRRLMHYLGIPNALVIAHNTLSGGHLMGGVEAGAGADGLWNYWSSNPDRPSSPRYFSVVPRMGGVAVEPTRVDLIDGRLTLRNGSRRGATDSAGSPTPADEPREAVADLVMRYVETANASGHDPSARDLRSNVAASNREVDAARDALVEQGRLSRTPREGRGGGFAYRITRQAEPDSGGNESK